MSTKKFSMKRDMVKISSKGQFTLPFEIREKIGIKRGDFLKTYAVGENLVILEKVRKTPFEELTERFAQIAEEGKLTPEKLKVVVKEARRKVNKELYGKKT